jgi:hypothetical protein
MMPEILPNADISFDLELMSIGADESTTKAAKDRLAVARAEREAAALEREAEQKAKVRTAARRSFQAVMLRRCGSVRKGGAERGGRRAHKAHLPDAHAIVACARDIIINSSTSLRVRFAPCPRMQPCTRAFRARMVRVPLGLICFLWRRACRLRAPCAGGGQGQGHRGQGRLKGRRGHRRLGRHRRRRQRRRWRQRQRQRWWCTQQQGPESTCCATWRGAGLQGTCLCKTRAGRQAGGWPRHGRDGGATWGGGRLRACVRVRARASSAVNASCTSCALPRGMSARVEVCCIFCLLPEYPLHPRPRTHRRSRV